MSGTTLALHGGAPVRTAPFPTGRRFGEEELANLRDALEQNTLFYWHGKQVKQLMREFADMYGAAHCVAASSGTAAIHVALGACGVSCGDEVITSPVTDMGSVIGILYQNALPVFADLDPRSYTLDPESVRAKITPRTKAILVVHLAGNPTNMDPIMELAREHGLYVIEDCAQSYHARYKGRMVGTIGHMGCFSLNDFKQITAGDGGLVLTNDDALYAAALRFADKNYERLSGSMASMRQVPFLAPNYRMTELTGAVARAQIQRLEGICARRQAIGTRLNAGLADIPGVLPPAPVAGSQSTYWFYMFRVDEAAAGAGRDAFCEALAAEGVPNQRGYIPSCVYQYDLFQDRSAYPGSHYPFSGAGAGEVSYPAGLCPVAEEILATAVRIPLNEFYSDADVDDIIRAVRKVAAHCAGGQRAAR